MKKITNRQIQRTPDLYLNEQIEISGWIRNHRDQKSFGFIDLNDGTFFKSIQVVYTDELENFSQIKKFRIGSALKVTGTLIKQESRENLEISAIKIELLGDSLENYPIQPKRHTREFLREKAHLRVRTNLFQAVFRIRSITAAAVHEFFQQKDFVYLHAPIITASDAEGAGEMFQVTNFDLNKIPYTDNKIDYKKDFFSKAAHLTVSGQLSGEAFALAFKDIYTFGPTFRAENSNTQRHASEFWMIEPEIAFADLEDNMALAEEMVKFIVEYVMNRAKEEIDFLNQFVDKTLKEKLENVISKKFATVEFKDAIQILQDSKQKFENKPLITEDLATEHEKYLVQHFQGPVFVINWPKEFKAFYMRLNDDNKTVAAMDLLVPGSGELIGGSQREERLDILNQRIKELKIDDKDLWWYKELREYGSVKHAGFGLGFERMVMYLTGVDNIRDVIPFPRTPNNCEF